MKMNKSVWFLVLVVLACVILILLPTHIKSFAYLRNLTLIAIGAITGMVAMGVINRDK